MTTSSTLTAPQCFVLIDRLHKCYSKYLSGLISQAIDSTTTVKDEEIPDYPPPPYSPPLGGEMADSRGQDPAVNHGPATGSDNAANNTNPSSESRTQEHDGHQESVSVNQRSDSGQTSENQPANVNRSNVGGSHPVGSTAAPNPPVNPTRPHNPQSIPASQRPPGHIATGWPGTPATDGYISPRHMNVLRAGILLDHSTWQYAQNMFNLHTDYALRNGGSMVRVFFHIYSEPEHGNEGNGPVVRPILVAPQNLDGRQEFNPNQPPANDRRFGNTYQLLEGSLRSQSHGFHPSRSFSPRPLPPNGSQQSGNVGLQSDPRPNSAYGPSSVRSVQGAQQGGYMTPQNRAQDFRPPGPSSLRAAESAPPTPVQQTQNVASPWQSQSHGPNTVYGRQANQACSSQAPNHPASTRPVPPLGYAPIQPTDALLQAQAGSSSGLAPQLVGTPSQSVALQESSTGHAPAAPLPLETGENARRSSAISLDHEEKRPTIKQHMREEVAKFMEETKNGVEDEKIFGPGSLTGVDVNVNDQPARQSGPVKLKKGRAIAAKNPNQSTEASGPAVRPSKPTRPGKSKQAKATATKTPTQSTFPSGDPILGDNPNPILSDPTTGSKRKSPQMSTDATSPAHPIADQSSFGTGIAQARNNWGTAAGNRTRRASKVQKTDTTEAAGTRSPSELEAQETAKAAEKERQKLEKERVKQAKKAEKKREEDRRKQEAARELAARRYAYAQGRRDGE